MHSGSARDQLWPLPPGAAAEAYGEQDPAFKRLREKSMSKRVAKAINAAIEAPTVPTPAPQPSQPKPAPDADAKGYRLPYKDD